MSNRPKLRKLAYMLGVYSQKTIPQTYINELSNYELLLTILSKINEIIERFGKYDDVINEIINYLDTLDDDVLEEVQSILDGWKSDGTIKDMLDDISGDYFEQFQNEINNLTNDLNAHKFEYEQEKIFFKDRHCVIDAERMFRFTRDTAHFMAGQPSMSIADDDTRVPHYSFAQGSTHFMIGNTGYFACIYISNDGSKFSEGGSDHHGNGLIEVYNHNGDILYSRVFDDATIGHGNSLAYHNGYLYYQGDNKYNDIYAGAKLRRVKWDLTGTVTTVVLHRQVNGTEELFYGNGLASYNNKLYITSAKNNEIDVAEIEMESDNITATGNVINFVSMTPTYIGYSQNGYPRTTVFSAGFAVTKDYFYFGTYKPNGVIRCVRRQNSLGEETSFHFDWFYEIPKMLNYGLLKTGELEGIGVDEYENIYLITTQHLNTKSICMGDITQFFVFNPVVNNRLAVVNENEHTGRQNIYVTDGTVGELWYEYDENNPENPWGDKVMPNTAGARARTVIHTNNPFGTNQLTDAFGRIDEACWYFNNLNDKGYGRFQFEGSFGHLAFCSSGKTYYFDGKKNTHSPLNDNSGSITILGNMVIFGGIVHIENCRFFSSIHYLANRNPSATREENLEAYILQKQNPIFANDCVLTILNSYCYFGNNPNVTGAIYLRNCTGNFNIDDDATTAINNGQNYWINSGRYFMNLGTCMINVHKALHSETNLSANNAINLAT